LIFLVGASDFFEVVEVLVSILDVFFSDAFFAGRVTFFEGAVEAFFVGEFGTIGTVVGFLGGLLVNAFEVGAFGDLIAGSFGLVIPLLDSFFF